MSLKVSPIVEFGKGKNGTDDGNITFIIHRDELSKLNDGELGILHAMLGQCANKIAIEYNFRHMKAAPLPPEPIKETP